MFNVRRFGLPVLVGVLIGFYFVFAVMIDISVLRSNDAIKIDRANYLVGEQAKELIRNSRQVITDCSGPVVGARNIYPISLNYRPTFHRLQTDGEYAFVNDRINAENFTIVRRVPVMAQFQFVHFNKDMSWFETIWALALKGLRPANLTDLMIFRANYPDEVFKTPIVAMGSTMWHPYGWWAMPYLQFVDGQACLDLTSGDNYDPHCMVAALPFWQ